MTPGGAPLAAQGLDASQIGPGVAGFLAIFAITLASWVLFRSMNRHLRTVRRSQDPAAGDTASGEAAYGDPPREAPAGEAPGEPPDAPPDAPPDQAAGPRR